MGAEEILVALGHDRHRARRRADLLQLERARALSRDHCRHRVPWALARYASAAHPSRLRLPAFCRAIVRLSRHPGRDGRSLWYDAAARHPRLGAAKARLPRLSRASLVAAARRVLAAPL